MEFSVIQLTAGVFSVSSVRLVGEPMEGLQHTGFQEVGGVGELEYTL